jgi:hypothetical protein
MLWRQVLYDDDDYDDDEDHDDDDVCVDGDDDDSDSDNDAGRGDCEGDDDALPSTTPSPPRKTTTSAAATAATDLSVKLVTLLNNPKHTRETKITIVSDTLGSTFPKVEGDKVTFIGSTFVKYGQNANRPYLSNCIVMDTCDNLRDEVPNSEIESYSTESEVLLAWTRLIQKENPDIIIGYNIFGFDYQFMFHRAEENNCVEDFLKLSRNKDEVCGTMDKDGYKWKIEESTIQIASGQHDLHFIKMNGRLQVDLYNFYRREANLISYKLDYVAGNFIGDFWQRFQRFTRFNYWCDL